MVEVSTAKARRERERYAQRKAILEAAQKIAASEGWPAVTTRKVAEHIEYSHPTLYEHFPSKQALLVEINRAGYRQLLAALQAARKQHPNDFLEAARAMAQAYCNFAWQHRELYEVMHGLSGTVIEPASYQQEGMAVIAEARAMIETWAEAEHVKVCNADDAVLILWSTLHGIASLALSKQMIGGKKHAAELATRAVDDLFAAWRAAKCV
jgi:AcrR family transcriptional regulator